MGRFGEPWEVQPYFAPQSCVIHRARTDEGRFGPAVTDAMAEADADHIVACVNALSSVPRPEKVGALLEIVRQWSENAGDDPMEEWANCALDSSDLYRLLAAYRACMAEEERDG